MVSIRRIFSRARAVPPHKQGSTDARHGSADARKATVEHLRSFSQTRAGVEAYVEPATATDPMTLILIATTGEWTRRRVPDEKAARKIAADLGLPCYDVRLTGYPQRMRDWNSRQRERRRESKP